MTHDQAYISSSLIASVTEAVRRDEATRHKLPGGGRVHIDRQLPFLCLYRRPPDRDDRGTDRLLLGEAAYILADGAPQRQSALISLVTAILERQKEAFGASFLLELWCGPEVTDAERRPAFRIAAPAQAAPAALLEDMEQALLGIRINDQQAAVSVDYQQRVGPPGMVPLLDAATLGRLGCTHLGLAVSPIYRDVVRDSLLPFRLRALHHALAHALKRTFYSFLHTSTPLRPAHFLELGQRAMTAAVHDTDERLAAISAGFDLLLHVTPVNVPAAWQSFCDSNCETTPEFLYRPRAIDPDLTKRQLFTIPIEAIEDPTLAYIFTQKRDELDRQITLVADRNTPRFLLGSRQLFGDVDAGLLHLARQILAQAPGGAPAGGGAFLGASEFAERARAELDWYRQQDPELVARVEVRADVPGIMVSQGNFLIGADAQVPKSGVNATLAHEIGTHVLTHHNGSRQPFRELYAGMAGYEPLQEGLAVLGEFLVGELTRVRLRVLAGRVLAVQMITDGAEFIETYRALRDEYGFASYTAFTTAMRVYRGGGYTKDAVYLRGLVEVLEYLAAGEDIDRLYLGKIAHEHLALIDELQWRQVLQAPRLRPRFLAQPDAAERLARLRSGLTAMEMMGQAC